METLRRISNEDEALETIRILDFMGKFEALHETKIKLFSFMEAKDYISDEGQYHPKCR